MLVSCVIWSICLLSVIVAERRRYFCDTWEEAKQASVFGEFEHRYPTAFGLFYRLRRIIGHGNEIWFLFNNRTFYTERIEIDELVDEDLGPTSFLLGDVYIDEREDKLVYWSLRKRGLNVGGHLYRSTTSLATGGNDEVFEFYRVNYQDSLDNPNNPLHYELYEYFYHLDFSGGEPKRTELGEMYKLRPEEDFRLGNQDLKLLLEGTTKPFERINFALLIETSDLKLAILNALDSYSGKYSQDEFPNHFGLIIEYSPKRGPHKDKLFIDEFGGYKVSWLQKRLDHMIYGHLLKVDTQNPVNYGLFLMEVYKPFSGTDQPRPLPSLRFRLGHFIFQDKTATEWTFQVTWDHLLSCHTWDSNEMPVDARGVYYDRASKAFFVFIKRFYLRYERDLVMDGFYLRRYEMDDLYLRKEQYFEQAEDIKFEADVSNVKWDLGPRMYVKNFAERSYLTPAYLNFAIATGKSGKLTFKRLEDGAVVELATIRFCFRQTFELDRHVFCFDEEAYRLIHKPDVTLEPRKISRTKIARIFDTAPFEWKDWPIKFIFNYKENLIVFMSFKFLFVFSYKNFQRYPNDTIFYVIDETHIPLMGDVCFFDPHNCFKSNLKIWPLENTKVRK